MHGVIMVELRNFVTQAYDGPTWEQLLKNAGLWPRLYVPVAEYPDEEVFSLVSHASKMTGLASNDLLEKFGLFISMGLLKTYKPLIKTHWTALDLLENTEKAIHTAIRLKDKRANPPKLQCRRVSASEVVITYNSPRKLYAVAKGIALGVAKHYKEDVAVEISGPMLSGGDVCELRIRKVGADAGRPIPKKVHEAPTFAEPEPRPRQPQPVASTSPRRKRKSLWQQLLFWRK